MPASVITVLRDPAAPSLEERAYRSIRDALMSGVFLPGARLSIRRVAAALGTSPMPARVALGRLVAEQVLEVLPNGTTVVPRLTRAGFIELNAIRARLEPLATAMAAPHVDAAMLARLEALLPRLIDASARGDVAAMLTANQQFMFEIYRAAEAPLLLSMIESLWLRRGPMYWGAWDAFLRWGGPLPFDRHTAIVASLQRHDGDSAATAIREEIDVTTAHLLRAVQFADDPPRSDGLVSLAVLGPGGDAYTKAR